MGCFQSVEIRSAQQNTKVIDKHLGFDAECRKTTFTFPVLGAENVGNKTFLRMLSLLYIGMPNLLVVQRLYRNLLYKTLLSAVLQIVSKLPAEFQSKHAELWEELQTWDGWYDIDEDLAQRLTHLFNLKEFQNVLEHHFISGTPQIGAGTLHLMEEATLSRLSAVNYKPTEEDILLMKTDRLKVTEVEFRWDRVNFLGASVPWRGKLKWIDQFDDASAIVFLISFFKLKNAVEWNTQKEILRTALNRPQWELKRFLLIGTHVDHLPRSKSAANFIIELLHDIPVAKEREIHLFPDVFLINPTLKLEGQVSAIISVIRNSDASENDYVSKTAENLRIHYFPRKPAMCLGVCVNSSIWSARVHRKTAS
jgi:hypothetical protein